jgi:protein-L-isoaspartate(D-aspartate) O-methyltransferase
VDRVPTHILDLLLPGGMLVAPVGEGADQLLAVVTKDCNGSVSVRRLFGVRFVPLTSVDAQLKDDSEL